MAAHTISSMLRQAIPNQAFYVRTCSIQNIVAHVELPPGKQIDLAGLYARFCECATYQKSIFPGLVLRLPKFPIVLLIFSSGRIVCTGGRSYDDIHCGFACIYKILKQHIITTAPQE
jgi:transcription initiation factor TFIID TATA-box-binding protein